MKKHKSVLGRPVAGTLWVSAGLVLAASSASAQMSTQIFGGAQGDETLSAIIQVVANLVMAIIFGIILLIARRNMKGWNHPWKWVWFSFQGRLNRKAYWLQGAMALSLVSALFQAVISFMGLAMVMTGVQIAQAAAGISVLLLMVPFIGFYLWASLGISIKRMHDVDKSGWFLLLMIVPILNLWPIILAMFIKGTDGANKYGNDPLYYEYDDDDENGPQAPVSGATAAAGSPASPAAGGLGNAKRKPAFKPASADQGTRRPPPPMGADGSPSLDTIRERLGSSYGGGEEPVEGQPVDEGIAETTTETEPDSASAGDGDAITPTDEDRA